MFYDKLIKLCNEKGEKITPLVKRLNISPGSIGNWQTGSIPNGETLIKFANYFNVSLDYLVGRTDNPEVNK